MWFGCHLKLENVKQNTAPFDTKHSSTKNAVQQVLQLISDEVLLKSDSFLKTKVDQLHLIMKLPTE